MNEFSLEGAIEDIYDIETKRNFKEVLSSYHQGNYRSAVVMLWSTIICDLIYKINTLQLEYDDKTAEKIFKEVKKIRESNPKSSQWESDLVKLVQERTKLLTLADQIDLLQIQEHRHLSAHPIIEFEAPDQALYRPSKDQVRAHMRTALDKVLTKSPLISKDVLNHLLEEVEKVSQKHSDLQFLKKYLEGGILRQLSKELEYHLFKNLWKICFKVENEQSNKNRLANTKVLKVIYERNTEYIDNKAITEKENFSNFSDNLKDDVCYFTFHHENTFNFLNEAKQELIKEAAKENHLLFVYLWFLHEDLEKYFEELKNRFDNPFDIAISYHFPSLKSAVVFRLKSLAEDRDLLNKFSDLLIHFYVKSSSYSDADCAFTNCIKPHINQFNLSQLNDLIQEANDNDQCYYRRGAKKDHAKVTEAYEQLAGEELDKEEFSKFITCPGYN